MHRTSCIKQATFFNFIMYTLKSFSEMACSRFLEFQPTEHPSWRKIKDKNDTIPKVSEMITEILVYENTWNRIKNENIKQCSAVKQEMYLNFLYQIQIGEDIGVHDRNNFEGIIGNKVNKSNRRRGSKQEHTNPEIALKKSWLSGDHFKSNNADSQEIKDGTRKSSQYERLNSVDSLPTSLDAKDYFNKESTETICAKTTEAINLLHGYCHLKTEIKRIPKDERLDYLGILDVEVCIKRCHEILMKDVMDKKKTFPGKFSVLPRTAEFKGKLYHYPCYKTEDVANDAIQAIVDQYNKMLHEISNDKSKRNKLENSFKCASVLLFGFLTLHLFADGNGRLARLLCSHCLNVFSPFPTAIYNVFSPSTRDDYITAIVNARKNLKLSSDQIEFSSDAIREALLILEQKPADLCSLIIESSWFTWRHFLRKIGEDIPMLDFEKAD